MSSIVVAGDTSGTITIAAPAVAGSGTLTLPVATDTLAGIAATQTLTNKTLGTGTVFPAGAVLQVVSANYSTIATNATSTYADTGLTATITPTKNTSKILIIVSQNGLNKSGANSGNSISIKLMRDATDISVFGQYVGYTGTAIQNTIGSTSTNYLDSPATTSATTYKTRFLSSFNTSNVSCQTNSEPSTITLLEIAG